MLHSRKKIQSYIIDYERKLGQGSFAEVYQCQHQYTNQIYAVKIVPKNKSTNQLLLQLNMIIISQMPYATNQQFITHQNTPTQFSTNNNYSRFIQVFETQHNFYIIQQLCKQGSIREHLQHKKRLSQEEGIKCIQSVCLAFSELLKAAVLHRDLKPENLLLHEGVIKLADFGLAKKVQSQRQLSQTVVGTPLYMSPQILQALRYSSKCDVWSLGIVFYQLLYGCHPWSGSSQAQLVAQILNKPLYFPNRNNISTTAKNFLTQVLKIDEIDRISWIEVFEHQIFQGRLLSIAQEWRLGYERAAKQLDLLAKKVKAEQLIGVFFRFQQPTLDFEKFSQVMEWLIPHNAPIDFAIMYELFDKDFNGVIDIQQFVGEFNVCRPDILQLLKILIEKGYPFAQLQKEEFFLQVSVQHAKDSDTIESAHKLICNIVLL